MFFLFGLPNRKFKPEGKSTKSRVSWDISPEDGIFAVSEEAFLLPQGKVSVHEPDR
jgi:hypothetical protein